MESTRAEVYAARADIKKARDVRGMEHEECFNEYIGSKTISIPGFHNNDDQYSE